MPSSDAPTEEETTEVVDEGRTALLEAITSELGDAVIGHHLVPGKDLWVRVRNEDWAHTADYLRNRQRFRFFDWLAGIDWMPSPFGRSLEAEVDKQIEAASGADSEDSAEDAGEAESFETAVAGSYAGGETRFQVLGRVYSLATGIGVTVKTDVDGDLAVPTWTEIYPGADWHERETFEMYGIEFDGHPSLRKLYLPGDFEGYPLRKDFPLMARLIKPWPGIIDVEPMPDVAEVGTASPDAGSDGGAS